MNWEVGNFIDGVKAFAGGKKVKLYNPETEATVSMDAIIACFNGRVTFIENEPVDAIKPQDAGMREEEAQNPAAPEIQSEAGTSEEHKKRRGGRPKKQEGEKPAKEKKPVPVDRGKIRALYEAGWSVADIASDTHQTEETVREVLGL